MAPTEVGGRRTAPPAIMTKLLDLTDATLFRTVNLETDTQKTPRYLPVNPLGADRRYAAAVEGKGGATK
jgi:hypothetical protein